MNALHYSPHDSLSPTRSTNGCCVIVPVHNGQATLGACLAALRHSSSTADEIVVVDDGSTDGSAQIARDSGCRVVSTGDQPVGPGLARNLGVRETDAPIIVFVDSDVEVHLDTLQCYVEALRTEPALGAVFGSYDSQPASQRASSVYANLRHHHVHQISNPDAGTFWAGCGAIRRSAFEQCGGFSVDYARPSIEDIELGMRLKQAGYRIRLMPQAQCKHHKDWRVGQIWRTDVFCRAVPWSRLLVEGGGAGNDLNTRRIDKLAAVSVHAVWWGLLAAWILHPAFLLLSFLGTLGFLGTNLPFWRLVATQFGPTKLAVAMPLHAAYLLYSSVCYAFILGSHQWSKLNGRPLAKTVAVTALLALMGLVAILTALSSVNSSVLLSIATSIEPDPSKHLLDLWRINVLQRIVAAAGFLLLSVSPTLWVVLPLMSKELVRWCDKKRRLWAVVPRLNLLLLATTMNVAAVLIVIHLDQPYRSDEATTFLTFGLRHPATALATYQNPNNHMAHSLLMRGSVGIFGSSPQTIRLPAAAMMWCCIPMMYVVTRRYARPGAGVVAASLMAVLPFTIDSATNARGYPIVFFCTLVVIFVIPEVARHRLGGTLVFMAAAVLGAWAVPVMVYPFSIATLAILLLGMPGPFSLNRYLRSVPRHCLFVGLVVVTIGMGVILLYAPALTILRLRGKSIGKMLDDISHDSVIDRITTSASSLVKAWDQIVYPAVGGWQLMVLLVVIIGAVIGSVRNRQCRGLVSATLVAPSTVWAIFGFTGPPWWSLGFLMPIALIFFSIGITSGLELAKARNRNFGIGLAMLILVTAIPLWASSEKRYYQSYPHRVSLESVEEIAELIASLPEGNTLVIVSTAHWPNSLRMHLGSKRKNARISFAAELPESATDFDPQILVAIGHHDQTKIRASAADAVDTATTGWHLQMSRRYSDIVVEVFTLAIEFDLGSTKSHPTTSWAKNGL